MSQTNENTTGGARTHYLVLQYITIFYTTILALTLYQYGRSTTHPQHNIHTRYYPTKNPCVCFASQTHATTNSSMDLISLLVKLRYKGFAIEANTMGRDMIATILTNCTHSMYICVYNTIQHITRTPFIEPHTKLLKSTHSSQHTRNHPLQCTPYTTPHPHTRGTTSQITGHLSAIIIALLIPQATACSDFFQTIDHMSNVGGMETLKVVSVNIAGGLMAGEKAGVKLPTLVQMLEQSGAHIGLVQESHNFERIPALPKSKIWVSHSQDNPAARKGVAIVTTKQFDKQYPTAKVVDTYQCKDGGAVGVILQLENIGKVAILSLYFPAEGMVHATTWWNDTEGDVYNFCKAADISIVGGDLSSYLNTFHQDTQFNDLYHVFYNKCTHYTHIHNSTKAKSRLDSIFVYNPNCPNTQPLTFYASLTGCSDHMAMCACFGNPARKNITTKRPRVVPSVFASPDPEIREILNNVIDQFFNEKRHMTHKQTGKKCEPHEGLDSFKQFLRVELSRKKGILKNTKNEFLQKQCEVVEALQTEPGILQTKTLSQETKQAIHQYNMYTHQFALDSKSNFKKWISANWNKSTRPMWNIIRNRPPQTLTRTMSYTNTKKHMISTNRPEEVPNILARRLQDTFKAHTVHKKNWRKWTKMMPTTSSQHQSEVFGFSIDEVRSGFLRNGSHRASGPDGVPVVLWKTIIQRDDVAKLVQDVWNQAGQPTGHLPKSYQSCYTSMRWKAKGERCDASMYRPITISQVDYRAMHKCITLKVSEAVSRIIGPTQFAFTKGRQISAIAHALSAFLWRNEPNTAAVFLDVAGAYDTVPHLLLLDILKQCKFRPELIKLCNDSLHKVTTQVKINGVLSDQISFERGLRQGCPSAPWQWNLINALFVLYISDCITPIPILHQFSISIISFADDNCIYIYNKDARKLGRHLQAWERSTGTVFAAHKCAILPTQASKHGTWKNRVKTLNGAIPVLQEGDEPYAYAGMKIGTTMFVLRLLI